MESTDVAKYLDIAKRRKYWIIIPFLLSMLGGLGFFLNAPKVYEARTLILVQPQRVPEEFVRSIVSSSVEDRVRTITQQVTSRTNLEKIINEYHLMEKDGNSRSIDEMVSNMRDMIIIDVQGDGRNRSTSTFTIAFRGRDPKTITNITNALASNFMTENLRIREAQALGTSIFLSDELESVRTRLLEKESDLKEYREKYMGGLPEQLQTNLSILERLQGQLDQLNDNKRDAENRKIIIQTQIAEQSRVRAESTSPSTALPLEARDLQSLRHELASLEARYTAKHPDIKRLKETIARLEQKQAEPTTIPGSSEVVSALSGANLTLNHQLQNLDLEIKSLKAEISKTQSQISFYEEKVENTPKREQELLSLNRDYNNLKAVYDSLLNRKLEAEIAVSMEKKQKGEQFRVIDPAKVPLHPVEPDINRIIMIALILGLGIGVGLSYLLEMMDSSYKVPEDLEKELQLPVLVSIPIRYTKKELRVRSFTEFFKAATVAVCFLLSVAAIAFSLKGIDASLNYVKTVLSDLGVL